MLSEIVPRQATTIEIAAFARRRNFHASIAARAAQLAQQSAPAPVPPSVPVVEYPVPALEVIEDRPRPRETVWFWFVEDNPEPSIGDIKMAVCKHFGLTHLAMTAQRRDVKFMKPRQIAMFLTREMTGKSFQTIGRQFGGRDHTTVLHASRIIAKLIESDPQTAKVVEKLRQDIRRLT